MPTKAFHHFKAHCSGGMLVLITAGPDFALSRKPVLFVLPGRASPQLIKLVGPEADFSLEIGGGILRGVSIAAFRHLQKVLRLCFGGGLRGARGFCFGHFVTPWLGQMLLGPRTDAATKRLHISRGGYTHMITLSDLWKREFLHKIFFLWE